MVESSQILATKYLMDTALDLGDKNKKGFKHLI